MKKCLILAVCMSSVLCIIAEDSTSSKNEEKVLVENGEQDATGQNIKEDSGEELTISNRAEYFGKGLGYGVICGAALFGIYHCLREVNYRMGRPDHLKKLLDLYASLGRTPEPKRVARAKDANSAIRNAKIVYSAMPIGITYLLLKNKIIQKSIGNFKKAFQ